MTTPGEPQHPQPYSQSPYGQAVAGAPRPSGHSKLAWTALILASTSVIGSFVVSLTTLAMMYANRSSFAATDTLGGVGTVVFGLLAIAALILAVLAVRGSRPVVAGIAIGIAAAHLMTAVFAILVPIMSVLLGR